MSALTVYLDDQPQFGELYTDFAYIQNQLDHIGVQFERWTANAPLAAGARPGISACRLC